MYAGYVESPEKIEARKARILAGYRKPAKRIRVKTGGLTKPAAKTQEKG